MAVGGGGGDGQGGGLNNNDDPEFLPHQCLTWQETDKFLQEAVDAVLATGIQASLAEVKLHLHQNRWQPAEAASALQVARNKRAQQRQQQQQASNEAAAPGASSSTQSSYPFCQVCATNQCRDRFDALACGHGFCSTCWECYFDSQIRQGSSTSVSCMSSNCDEPAPETFVLMHLRTPATRQR